MRRRAISAACALALLAAPAGALADQPATDQYTPPSLSATGHGSGTGAGSDAQQGPATEASSGSGSPVVPILLGGLGVVAAAGLIVYRLRRAGREPA